MLLEISSLLAILGEKKATSFPYSLHANTEKMAFFKRKELLTFYISDFTLFTEDSDSVYWEMTFSFS